MCCTPSISPAQQCGCGCCRSIVDVKGPALTHAEDAATLFNDLCCLAPGALLSPDITWRPIDNRSVAAYFTLGVNTVRPRAALRRKVGIWRISSPTAAEPCPPTAAPSPRCVVDALRDYAEVGPARVATKAKVNWQPDSGTWTYGEFELTSLAYNVANRTHQHAARWKPQL